MANEDKLRVNLDCLDKVRDKASSRMTEYQRKMAEYYNKRVKLRQLDIGDLVLRKSPRPQKIDPQESWGPPGRDHIESSTTPEEAVITLKL